MKEAELFKEKGWFVLDFVDLEPLYEAKHALQQKMHELLGTEALLEKYHEVIDDDKMHIETQVTLKNFFTEHGFGPKIIEAHASFFQKLIGQDLLVQANPYLRITRPFKHQDNIGYHRDTFYGGSPFELSILIPYVDLPKESSLSVLTASHTRAEDYFPTHQVISEDTTKNSEKHKLGFLYAPKLMNDEIGKEMEAVELKFGQALVFSLSTVHGSVVNRGDVTRWSSDVRILNALAPVDLSSRPDYYKPLCYSPITECAQQYFEATHGAA